MNCKLWENWPIYTKFDNYNEYFVQAICEKNFKVTCLCIKNCYFESFQTKLCDKVLRWLNERETNYEKQSAHHYSSFLKWNCAILQYQNQFDFIMSHKNA